MIESKSCIKCDVDLVVGENWTESKRKYSQNVCGSCSSAYGRGYRADNTENIANNNQRYYLANADKLRDNQRQYNTGTSGRNAHLKRKFGITLDDYNRMFDDQDGCCAICSTHASEMDRNLAVDHNHRSGKVNALLCFDCNTTLGKMGDTVSGVMKFYDYAITHCDQQ